MRAVLGVLMLFSSVATHAQQQGITKLQCDGMYSNFLTGYRNVESTGGYAEIRESTVKLASVLGFEGTYDIHAGFTNEARIFFWHPDDRLIQGSINRLTGQLQISQQSKKPRQGEFGGFDQIWQGTCGPARPKF